MHRGRVFSEKRRSEALKNEGVGVDESSLVLGRTRRHCQTSKSKMGKKVADNPKSATLLKRNRAS